MKAARAAVLGAAALVGAEGTFAVGVLEGPAATQRSTIADVADLTIHTDFEEVRVFAADRQDVEVELSVSERMSRRNRPELAVDRDGAVVTLRVGGNDLPISRASVEWGPKLTLSVPAGVELTVRTGSGAVVVQGLRSERLEVFTAEGDVFVGDCGGPLLVAVGSGSLRVARCDGDKRLTSTSGAIDVADARGTVIAHTESGAQRFFRIEGDLTVLRGTELEVSEHRGRLIVEDR
ncbi:MAG: hypothetical protein OXJ90_28520 [Spirochaetaceae bacterium]|nr:hypothetical protein [Spirochaetaceae bacterium]